MQLTVAISRSFGVLAYGVARQAERSLDFGLQSREAWAGLRQYYAGVHTQRVDQILSMYGEASDVALPDGKELRRSLEHSLFSYVVARVANLSRSYWTIAPDNLRFFLAKLARYRDLLQQDFPEDRTVCAKLRMDLYVCGLVFASPMIGVNEIKRASAIEHYLQARHINPVRFDDLR